MAESLSLPLRPSVVANPTEDSLQVRIEQINKQKGAFRHVTEASLLREIDHDGRGNSDVDMESEGEEDALKPEDRQALVWKGREAMLQQIE
jgi:mediator of RNA polymerase II transcription subunit 17, fungi type